MSDSSDVLREQYNAVINQETDWGFFVSLAGYVDYILEIPTLKKITNEVMLIKQKEYDKLAELEDKAIKELKAAKIKLLKSIKENNISPDSLGFGRNPMSQGRFNNILDQLEAFEEGKGYSISGFKSDNLMHFLFDIASSLLKMGHKSLVKDFLVSNEEYERYYYEPDSAFGITSNENKNFIFSDTLKLRREQTKLIENAKKYELWGAFDALLKFRKAFLEKSNNLSLDDIVKKYAGNARNSQEEKDAVDVVFFAEDLSVISGNKSSFANQNTQYHLKKDRFKTHLSRVNAYLLKELTKHASAADTKKQRVGNNDENYLRSLDLVTESLNPTDVIFLVLDKHFDMPIRCQINNKGGATYIRKLHDIAYPTPNAPGKRVAYNKALADYINNALFKKRQVHQYMKTNKLKKPRLVQKSKEGALVLSHEIPVEDLLIKNIPSQDQKFYRDKRP